MVEDISSPEDSQAPMAVQGVACQGGGWQSRGGQARTAAWPQAAAALQWSGGSVSCLKTSTCQLLCLMTSTARVFKERNSSLVNLCQNDVSIYL